MRSTLCGLASSAPPRLMRALLAVLLLALASPAAAIVVGTYPKTPTVHHQVHGRAVVIGATMMKSSKDSRYNDNLLQSGTETITGGTIPADASVKVAWLTWSGSAHNPTNGYSSS